MRSSTAEHDLDVRPMRVVVTEHHVTVDLEDGRTLSVPLTWYPRLLHGTPAERSHVELWDDGICWPDLNADMSIRGLLLGKKSGESPKSFQRWLGFRARGETEPIPELPLPPALARILASERRRLSSRKSRKSGKARPERALTR